MDDTATPTQTEPLTERQAHVLNALAQTCSDLRSCLYKVRDATAQAIERAEAGQHFGGFSGDLFGQYRYQADADAVKRDAEVRTAHVAECPQEAIAVALVADTEGGHVGAAHWFTAGDTFPVAVES